MGDQERCPTCGRKFAHSRTGDSPSAEDAAKYIESAKVINVGSRKHKFLRKYLSHYQLTDSDVAEPFGIPRGEASKRLSDLRLAGYIERTGAQRRNPRTNRLEDLCALTHEGSDKLRELQNG